VSASRDNPAHPATPLSAKGDGWQALEWTLEASCMQVGFEGCSLDSALAGHLAYLSVAYPFTHAALCAFLEATGNVELLALALGADVPRRANDGAI
jgi:hypothetical protein